MKQFIVAWCNGSTKDFGSFGLGSSPGATILTLMPKWWNR